MGMRRRIQVRNSARSDYLAALLIRNRTRFLRSALMAAVYSNLATAFRLPAASSTALQIGENRQGFHDNYQREQNTQDEPESGQIHTAFVFVLRLFPS
jgi:hypothetical protein